MNAGNGTFLGLAAVTVLTAAGCQTNETTVTWQEDGVPYFQYADSTRDHYRFTYHPNDQVYYQPYTRQYYWYENGAWCEGPAEELPRELTLEGKVTFVDVKSRYPFKNHDSVIAMHPPRRPTPDGFDGRETVLMVVEAPAEETNGFMEVVDHPMLMDEALPAGETFVFENAGAATVDDDFDADGATAHGHSDPDGVPVAEVTVEPTADEEFASADWDDYGEETILFDDLWIWLPEHIYRQFQRLHQPDGTIVPTAPGIGAAESTEMHPFAPADPASEPSLIGLEESEYSADGTLVPITPVGSPEDVRVVEAGSDEPSDD